MKIDLHTHSIYSDGCNTLEEMAVAAKDNGHACLVVTDHDFDFSCPRNSEGLRDTRKFMHKLDAAKQVEDKLGFPVIVDMEISMYYEEALLFGKDAILSWLHFRRGHKETWQC